LDERTERIECQTVFPADPKYWMGE